MSTHNIGFNEEISKVSLNYHQISSNTHLISSVVRLTAKELNFSNDFCRKTPAMIEK